MDLRHLKSLKDFSTKLLRIFAQCVCLVYPLHPDNMTALLSRLVADLFNAPAGNANSCRVSASMQHRLHFFVPYKPGKYQTRTEGQDFLSY